MAAETGILLLFDVIGIEMCIAMITEEILGLDAVS